MPTYTQAGRLMAVSTPLGKDALLLELLSGSEAVSELFQFELDLLAEADTPVKFEQILGQPATVTIDLPDGRSRYLNGVINRFSQGPQVRGVRGDVTFVRYKATLVPKLWFLTRRARCRIFQQVGVPAILREVLAGIDVKFELQGTYEPRDYCVQYRETDFDFASRLMEEEGIYYYFQHTDGGHKMVVADTTQSHASVTGQTAITYQTMTGGNKPDDRITGWVKTQEVRSGKWTAWDHCFELPGKHLEAEQATQDSVAVGTVTHKLKVGGNDQLEIYDYPGGYAQRFDGTTPGGGDRAADVQKIFQDNKRTVGIRMQQEAVQGIVIVGESNCRQMTAGHKFTLQEHFNANGEYVLTRVDHRISLIGVYTGEHPDGEAYVNQFRCIPSALPFRPPQVTTKGLVYGTQTATVVGPAGEEIFTDKYGRVKVQFPWDREGKNDASSSCWVRVGTVWAGKQWGAIHIPRIGQEVVIAFEEGDPDRPIIVGSVYNAEQMPPYTLPANKTQSGMKSRSTLQGTPDNFNELRFEDKKGSEQVYFHAEKNFDRVVENNDTLKVGFEKKDKGDQTVEIFNNQTEKIGAGKTQAADGSQSVDIFNNQTLVVGSGNGANADGSQTTTIFKDRTATLKTGNDTLSIKQGNLTTTLDMGNETRQLKMGNRDTKLDMGNDSLKLAMGNQTTKLDLGAASTEAMQSITLKVGQSSIVIDQTGVTIKGLMISVEGTVQTEVKGLMTQVSGSAMTTVKGAITMIN